MKYCPRCGTEYEDWATICAECNVVLGDTPISIGVVEKYGMLWRRFLSTVIDVIIMGVIFFFIRFCFYNILRSIIVPPIIPPAHFDMHNYRSQMVLLMLIWILIYISFVIFYSTFFIGKYGNSPGQRLMKLKVLTEDEQKLGYKKALFRALVYFLLYNLPYGGLLYIISAINILDEKNEKRQAIHDKICKTVIMYKE